MNTLATNLVLAAAEMEPRLFDLDLQLLADSALMIVAVFALFLIASHLLFNPVREMMQKRQERIKTELDTAASDMEEAKALREEYAGKMNIYIGIELDTLGPVQQAEYAIGSTHSILKDGHLVTVDDTEEKLVSHCPQVLTHPTAQSRTDFLLP